MSETPFEVAVAGGTLHGHRDGEGPPALLLHGGPAIPDYLDGLGAELGGLVETLRYTQRGARPSDCGPPYTIESHVADATAVLDAFGIERAWAIGHSWGGHLALHLLVSRPERLLGVVCVGTLGAFANVFAEQDANLRRGLSAEQIAWIEGVEARRRAGEVTEQDLLERWALLWPQFFVEPGRASPPPAHIGVAASIGTNRSIAEHFERGTLARGLAAARSPALFVHGEQDALPPRSSIETAALIPGAVVELIPDCGHFPWLERPGAVRDAVARFLSRT